MSYVAPDQDAYMGTSVPNGQCVAYVKAASGCPATSRWANGKTVKGADIPRGTAIATFQDGTYGNYTDGRSHAAIYMSQDDIGITVNDQWTGQPVHTRVIRFQSGAVQPRNDGDAFSVIEDRVIIARLTRSRVKLVKIQGKKGLRSNSKVT